MGNRQYIERLMKNLSVNISKKEQEKIITELISINDDRLFELLKYRNEIVAEVIINIGYPRVKKILPQLLEWLQDINWPGATIIAKFIASIGEPVIPYVREVLKGSDYTWQYWILEYVIYRWPKELIVKLEPELTRFSYIWDIYENGVDVIAMRIIAENGIGDKNKILQLYEYKRQRYKDVLNDLNSIEECINRYARG